MPVPFVETICPKCESIGGGRPNFCAECWEQGSAVVMMTREAWDAAERQKELEKRLYCYNCEHIGLAEEFPFDNPLEYDDGEQYCPICGSGNVINLVCVQMCENCDEVPAQKGDTWCLHCSDQFNTEFDDHPWDDFA